MKYKYFGWEAIKRAVFGLLVLWASIATFLLIRARPQTLLIGIDENGVRVIHEDRDRLVAKEKINFVKRYLTYAYNYDSQDFNEKITQAGNLMADPLWEGKKTEFDRISKGLKEQPITQETRIEDIRIIDDYLFEADLLIGIQTRLKREQIKLRVELRVQPHTRTNVNPFAWEVSSYVESQRS